MTKFLLATFTLLATSGCGGGSVPIPPGPLPGPPTGDVVQQLVDLHNQYRAKNNLLPLAHNPKLQAAADKHSAYQAKVGRMAHVGIGDGTPASRITAEGYQWTSLGENVAWNQANPTEVMASWIGSPGHRANILGNYREMGASVAKGADGSNYWTTDFGSTAGDMLRAIPKDVTPGMIPPVIEAK